MSRFNFESATDIYELIEDIVDTLNIKWIDKSRIFAFRSSNSSARAYARIWGLNRVWQKALGQKPAYVIEVLSEKFDKLSEEEKIKVLIHEICHIPQNFSGSLLPHTRKRGPRNFEHRVHQMLSDYQKSRIGNKTKMTKSKGTRILFADNIVNLLYSKNR